MEKGAGIMHSNMGFASRQVWHPKAAPCNASRLYPPDAAVSFDSLQLTLTYAAATSFNSISVNGDMSTNNSIYLLANGAAPSNDTSALIDKQTNPAAFNNELTAFTADLAQLVVRGATKFVTVMVKGHQRTKMPMSSPPRS
jgi:glutamate N-acetyltransferase / amino-acid N-acetyltransferase